MVIYIKRTALFLFAEFHLPPTFTMKGLNLPKNLLKLSTAKNDTALAVKSNDLFAALRQFRVGPA